MHFAALWGRTRRAAMGRWQHLSTKMRRVGRGLGVSLKAPEQSQRRTRFRRGLSNHTTVSIGRACTASITYTRIEAVREFRSRRPTRAAQGIPRRVGVRRRSLRGAAPERGEKDAAKPAHNRYSTAKFTIIMPSSCSRLWQWNCSAGGHGTPCRPAARNRPRATPSRWATPQPCP